MTAPTTTLTSNTTISGGQTSTGLTVPSPFSLTVLSGGLEQNSIVLSGGTSVVSAGGQASGDVLSAGRETVLSGGSATATFIGSGGTQIVSSGGVASGTVVSAGLGGGTGQDLFGGSSYQTNVVSGYQQINAGGVATGSTVGTRGIVFDYTGGLVAGTVNQGNVEIYGGVESGTVDEAGSTDNVTEHGSAVSTTVSGGTQYIYSTGVAIDTTVLAGGSAVISSGGTAVDPIVGGGSLVLRSGGMIDETTLPYSAGATAGSIDGSTDLLTVNAGGSGITEQLSSSYAGDTVYTWADGSGGTIVSLVACYGAGTMILAPGGERAIEEYSPGDLVVTASGETRAVRWVGRRSYGGRFLRRNADMYPVVFRAGSLGEGVPNRDLFVSPRHAMLLDGILVPAEALVNGVSVVRIEPGETVDYLHLELETHDALVANGAASESFADDDSRGMFQNAASYFEMYPGAKAVPAVYCAPRVERGYEVAAIRARIAERAGARSEARPAGALRGFVDEIRFDAGLGWIVDGWAMDADRPDSAVHLDILLEGVIVARTLANRLRADVRDAGLGGGHHGFSARLPGLSPSFETLTVRRTSDCAALAMSEAFGRAA